MAKSTLFEIKIQRPSWRRCKLRFLKSRVVLDSYCRICQNWTCGANEYHISRRWVKTILGLPIGVKKELPVERPHDRTCVRPSTTQVRIGCQKFTFTPAEMRRIRKWANG